MRIARFRLWVPLILIAASAQMLAAALDFNNGNLGSVVIGQASFQLKPLGGIPPYIFSYAPGATPIPGFRVINRPEIFCSWGAGVTGGLVGMALTAGAPSTMIRLTDSTSAYVDKTVSFTVTSLDLIGNTNIDKGVGDVVTFKFYGVGGAPPYTFDQPSGTLPPGLTLDGPTGILSGTATTAGSYTFTVRVRDSAPVTYSRGYTVKISALRLVNAPTRILPNGNVNLIYIDPANPAAGGFQLEMAGGTPPYTFTLVPMRTISCCGASTLPTGITLSSAGFISGTPTASTYNALFEFTVTDGGVLPQTQTYNLVMHVLPATPAPLRPVGGTSPAPVSREYWSALSASGGVPPYTFDVAPGSTLPDGVVFDGALVADARAFPGWAKLLPHVQVPGTYNFVMRTTDSVGNVATRPYTLNVGPLTQMQSRIPTCGAHPKLNTPYSQYLIPAGGTPPYTTSAPTLPAGFTIDSMGLLSGTPQETAVNNWPTRYISDSAGNQSALWDNVWVDAPNGTTIDVNGGDLGWIQRGSQYTRTLTCSYSPLWPLNPPNYSVTLVSGSLPGGLALLTGNDFNNSGNVNYCGQIGGVPTTPGSYSFILKVTDGAGNMGQRQFTMRVSSLAILTSALATGLLNAPYSQTIVATGGTPPYTFSIDPNTPLPPGLGIDPHTGVISGTPSTSSAMSVTIQVTDAAGDTITRGYTLTIYSLQITTPNLLPTAVYGQPYSVTFTPSPAGSYTWTISSNPSGLSLNSSTGVLSGTPNSTGATYSFSVTAGNGVTVVTKTFTLFMTSAQASSDITGLPTSYLGEYVVGQTVNYTLGASGGTPPYVVTLVAPSTLPPGLSLVPAETYSVTSGFGRWAIAGVLTTPGYYSFVLRYCDSAALPVCVNRTISMNITTLSVATTNLQPALVNTPYSAQLWGAGGSGSYSFSLANLQGNILPPGLGLSSSGLLSGTPTSTGSFSFTLTLTNGGVSRNVTPSLTIYATGTRYLTLSFGPIFSDGVVGRSYVTSLSPSGGAGTHAWTVIGTLPPGMQLLADATLPTGYSPPTAVSAGAPSAAGTYSFAVRVDDSTGNFAIRNATWVVSPLRLGPINKPINLSTGIPPGRVGIPYSFTLTGVTGTAPYTFTTEAGTYLPTGITLSSTGVLGGTPTDAGNFLLYLLVTDAAGNTRRASFSYEVFPAGRPIGIGGSTSVTLPGATVGTDYSYSLNDLLLPAYGTPPIVWTLASGSLPSGLFIVPGSGSSSATITGQPAAPGGTTVSLLATDANGMQHFVRYVTINVSVMGISPLPSALPAAIAGVPYSQAFVVSGTPSYTLRATYDSDMPAGLSFTGGILSGTPTVSGPFLLYLEAVDALNNVFRQRYTLNISPAGTPVPSLSVSPASINVSYGIGNPAPAPIPLSIASTSTAFNYSVSASGGPWLSVSPNTGVTPGAPNVTITPPGVGAYSGAITLSSAAAINSPITIPVWLVVSAPVQCSYSLGTPSGSFPAAAGSGSFGVNTTSSCNWTASTSDSWISISSPGSGTGSGTVNFSFTTNSPSPTTRTGTIAVGGLTYTVVQFGTACSYSLSQPSVSVTAPGGTGSITVNASSAACSWNTSNANSWITVPPPASGAGSGSVGIVVAVNPSSLSRSGAVMIAGQPLTVDQTGAGCNYSLSTAAISKSSAGGPDSVGLSAPAGCSWTVDPGPSWITITSGASGSGSGTINMSIAPNSTPPSRSAAVLVGGQTVQVAQAGVPCSFSISSNNLVQPAGGGSGSVDITAAGSNCGWVVSSNASWLTVSPPSGSGSQTVTFSVGANGSTAARTAALTVAGQNIIINQSGLTCSYSLMSSSSTMPAPGGPNLVSVMAAPGCGWTAVSNVNWIAIAGGASFSGPADVSINVDPNLTAVPRTGTLTVASQTFTVTQAGATCQILLNSPSFSANEFGGTGSFTYNTSVSGCNPAVLSYASWIVVTLATYSGTAGSVNFSVDANTYAAARSGTINVAGQTFTVNQGPSTCAYTLKAFGATFYRLGGNGSVPVAYAPPACGPPPVLVNAPAGGITLGSISSSPGMYTQNFAVGIYQSFINYTRTAQLLVSGQVFTVKQNSWDSY